MRTKFDINGFISININNFSYFGFNAKNNNVDTTFIFSP